MNSSQENGEVSIQFGNSKASGNRGNHSCGSMGGTAGAERRESSRDPRLSKGQGNGTAGSLSLREC